MRDWLQVCLLALLVLLAFLVDNNAIGIVGVFWAALAALVSASLFLPSLLPRWLHNHPYQGVAIGTFLVLLVVLYQLSQSPDTSFSASWLLVIGVLTYLMAVTATGQVQNRTWWFVGGLIALSALYSIWDFVANGVRAQWPLGDPNNYASLIYLAWVPWLHLQLRADANSNRWMWGLLGTLIASVAMFATESRAGIGIMLAAFVFWLGLGVFRKLSFAPILLHLSCSTLAFVGCVLLLGADGVAPSGNNTVGGGLELRLQLIQSALGLYPQTPFSGIGLSVFAAFYAAKRPLSDQVTAGRLVHNDYVQFLLEGGPLLLIALLGVALFAAMVLFRAVRTDKSTPTFARAGFALAACLLFAHALVNFVFYRSSLIVIVAIVLAIAQRELSEANAKVSATTVNATKINGSLAGFWQVLPKGWIWGPLLSGWLAFAYLTIDLVTAGVIEGQTAVPFSQYVGKDAKSVQAWARTAQRLNGDRGLPLLADAAISAQQLGNGNLPDANVRMNYVIAKFREALEADPWNTGIYMEYYGFLQRYPKALASVSEEEEPTNLLLRAVSLNRQFVPALDELLRVTEAQPKQRERILDRLIRPWMELIARQDLAAARRYLGHMEQRLPAEEVQRLKALFEGVRLKNLRAR